MNTFESGQNNNEVYYQDPETGMEYTRAELLVELQNLFESFNGILDLLKEPDLPESSYKHLFMIRNGIAKQIANLEKIVLHPVSKN